jgi:hypothetical protein
MEPSGTICSGYTPKGILLTSYCQVTGIIGVSPDILKTFKKRAQTSIGDILCELYSHQNLRN